MSFITDIAALAKAGYTPQDVKELMQLSKPAENLQKVVPIERDFATCSRPRMSLLVMMLVVG